MTTPQLSKTYNSLRRLTRVSSWDSKLSPSTVGSIQSLTEKAKSSIRGRKIISPPDWWFKAAEQDAQGIPRKKIAQDCGGQDKGNVTKVLGSSSRNLGQLDIAALLALDTVMKLKRIGYYPRLANRLYGPVSKRVSEYKAERAAAGYWMGGHAPIGYRRQKDGLLVINPETAPRVLGFYKRLADGESYSSAATAEGIKPAEHTIQSGVYLGKVRYRDREYPGQHQPIIDPDLHKRALESLDKRLHGFNKAPFGLRIRRGKYEPGDPKEVDKIQRAAKMRLEGAYYHDIAKTLGGGLSSWVLVKRLKDRRYVDAGVIDPRTFERIGRMGPLRPYDRMRAQGRKRETEILSLLAQNDGLSWRGVTAKTGLSQGMASRYLARMRLRHWVTKGPGKRDPYTITSEGRKIL